MCEEITIREMLKLLSQSLTQNQISELTGIPQSSISKIISGEITDVTYTRGRKVQKLHEQLICA